MNTSANVSLQDFQTLSVKGQKLSSAKIRRHLTRIIEADCDSMTADFRTRAYYINQGSLLWIDRLGVDSRADTLLAWLNRVGEMGFSTKRFCVDKIESNLQKLRSLDVDSTSKHDVNYLAAQLEYHLTKAYLRYAAGQRFGYTNPTYLLNRLDTMEQSRYDTVPRSVRYRGLFDVPMQHASRSFFASAISKLSSDSLAAFLHEVQPHNDFYALLQQQLSDGTPLTREMRARILCNMERCRWRQNDYPWNHKKYVLVNLPSMHLLAVDGSDTLNMRIGLGSYSTKTPLLNSAIKRMDINPKWFIPRSIIDKDIIHHVGNKQYFDSRHFYVVDRRTGKEVNLYSVTADMLRSKNYGVVQRGGKGNSLGRIIFRFDNNFSVFLHDTSSKDVFSRGDRSVSHGCIRVEKPFELAVFMMQDKDQRLIDKMEYCMTQDSIADKSMNVGSVNVQPTVPLFITYFTLYPVDGSHLVQYADIYGYDNVIYQALLNYL